jgi:hypothetical protein
LTSSPSCPSQCEISPILNNYRRLERKIRTPQFFSTSARLGLLITGYSKVLVKSKGKGGFVSIDRPRIEGRFSLLSFSLAHNVVASSFILLGRAAPRCLTYCLFRSIFFLLSHPRSPFVILAVGTRGPASVSLSTIRNEGRHYLSVVRVRLQFLGYTFTC